MSLGIGIRFPGRYQERVRGIFSALLTVSSAVSVYILWYCLYLIIITDICARAKTARLKRILVVNCCPSDRVPKEKSTSFWNNKDVTRPKQEAGIFRPNSEFNENFFLNVKKRWEYEGLFPFSNHVRNLHTVRYWFQWHYWETSNWWEDLLLKPRIECSRFSLDYVLLPPENLSVVRHTVFEFPSASFSVVACSPRYDRCVPIVSLSRSVTTTPLVQRKRASTILLP